jgi:phosphatidylglycerol---prolipoprotein diacylglyceryl transferase
VHGAVNPLSIIVINIDPVVQIGPFSVHWYGIMYAVAFIVAYRFGVLPLAVKRGVSRGTAEKITTWTIVFGLLGGRLYYDVQQPNLAHFLSNPVDIIAVWQGGMAFFGAIIAGFITLAVLAWRHRLNPWMVLDGGVLFAAVGQPIGRIGNIINGDILGTQSTLPWATAYVNPHAILQSGFNLCTNASQPGSALCPAYQPAAAYEALGTLVILSILVYLYRRNVRSGVLALVYVPAYAISQLILFYFRASEPPGPLGLREAQWTAIGMLVLATPLLIYLWKRTAWRFPDTTPKAAAPAQPAVSSG